MTIPKSRDLGIVVPTASLLGIGQPLTCTISVTNTSPLAASGVTQYGYDSAGNRTSATDALNRVTTYVYDADDRLTQVNAPLSTTTRYEYDANGNRTATVDALNQRTTYTYDAFNRQTAVTDALNHATQYQYDANGNRTRVTDANNHATNYQYDALNRLTRVTDALNNVTQYGYDATGNRTSVTDARGNTTTSAYDALNRVSSVTIPITGTTTGTTQYQYDAAGNRTRGTDANNNATNYQYDALNRVTRVTDAQNNATQYSYDVVSNRTSVTDAANQITTYSYDALNRVTTITNPSGKTQRTTYDAVSNRLTATDEISQTTRYTYDALNRALTVTDPLTQTTTYGYNAVGGVTTITNPVGQITNLSYDAVNRVTSKTMPLGTTQYSYDNVGNLLVLTDPSGATSTYTYNAVNWATQQDDRAPGGALVVSYTNAYDANGNRTSETETRPGKPARVTSYTYNKSNWLVATTDPGNGTITYAYDAAGNRTSTTDPLGVSTAVTFNALNLPAQTTHTQNGALRDTTTNTFDARQNLQNQVTVENSLTLTTTNTYNANNYLSRLQNADRGLSGNMSSEYNLTYTDNNLLTSFDVGHLGYNGVITYDTAGRVRCYTRDVVSPEAWSYYPDGNRKYGYVALSIMWSCADIPAIGEPGQSGNAVRYNYLYDGQRLIRRETQPYGLFDPPNAPLRGVSTYSYDGGGNLIGQVHADYTTNVTTTTSYNWMWQGSAHRLTNFTSSSGVTTTLDYDSSGRITRRYNSLGYSDYFYEDGTDWLVRETWHSAISGNVFDLVRYTYTNGRPTRMETPGGPWDLSEPWGYNTRYLQYNWHGDAVTFFVLDGAGDWITSVYDPWGGNMGSTYRWLYYRWNGAWGYQYFEDLGLYYAHGRWYNPDTGMWLSPNEKGDYMYGGDGQDAVNRGWVPLLTPELQLPDHGYISTRNYGYIDIKHMNEAREHTRDILDFLKDMSRPNPLLLKTGAGKDLRIMNYFEGLDAYYDVRRPIPDQLRAQVALGIFLDFEMRWERFQGISITQAGSSFSPEDLPSDYLGFYSAVSGNAVPVILDDILKAKGNYSIANDKPWWLDSRAGQVFNHYIDPMVCEFDWGVTCTTMPWPSTMRIAPTPMGTYWRLNRCEAYDTREMFGQYHRDQLICD